MRNFFLALILMLASATVVAKHSGYEPQLEEVVTTYKTFIEEVEKSFVRATFYFDNLENYESDTALHTPVFADNLSFTINTLFYFKDAIYANLKRLALLSNDIANRQNNYDQHLAKKHKDLLMFVATVPAEDMPGVLKEIFLDFKSQRNLLAVNAKDLRDGVQNNLVNTVNMFDLLEEFATDIMKRRGQKGFNGVTVKDVAEYGYMLGFLGELRKLYQSHNTLLEKINQALLGVDQYLKSFDSALEAMDFYYEKRFVEGIDEQELVDPEQPYSLKMTIDSSSQELKKNRELVCDKLLLNNFGIDDGLTLAHEITPYERFSLCPEISNSCCDGDLVRSLYSKYLNNAFSTLRRKYRLVEQTLGDILRGYNAYNKHAYNLLGSPNLTPTCEEKLRKLVFMPLNRDFLAKFRKELRRSQTFSLRAKANIFCMVCDHDFHSQAITGGKMVLPKKFCAAHTKMSLEFHRMFNTVIVEYVNNIIEAVQCTPENGEFLNEFELRLERNEELGRILDQCQGEEESEYCQSLCDNFSFHSLETTLDLDILRLQEINEYLTHKAQVLNLGVKSLVDPSLASVVLSDYPVQKQSGLGNRSIENLRFEFTDDDSDALPNPDAQGGAIVTAFIRDKSELDE